MSNVVDFQEWKDRKSLNEVVFVSTPSNTYLFMHDTSEVLYTITADEGEDYCIEILGLDGKLFEPKRQPLILQLGETMEYLERMKTIDKAFTVEKCDNGYMLRASGIDVNDSWGDLVLVFKNQNELMSAMETMWALKHD